MHTPGFFRFIPEAMEEGRDEKLVPQHSSTHKVLQEHIQESFLPPKPSSCCFPHPALPCREQILVPRRATAPGLGWKEKYMGKAEFARELEEWISLLSGMGHVQNQPQRMHSSFQAINGLNPIPPSPHLCQRSQHFTYPANATDRMGTKSPWTLQRKILVPGLGLAPGANEEGILAVATRARSRGSKKQLKILTAGSVTGSRS